MNCDVVIVGAGPVGLTLALDLENVVLIEKKEEPQFLPKMERCNARTMEIFRRLGVVQNIRNAGLRSDVPMDVFVCLDMTTKPLVHLKYESAAAMQERYTASEDLTCPSETYQLISQYTLEPTLKALVEALPNVKVCYGHSYEGHNQNSNGVITDIRKSDGSHIKIHSQFMVGCDGGNSAVRRELGIKLRGEGGILKLHQALYKCDKLFDMIPIGAGPTHGRHYHIADERSSFLIMQDSTRHWTLHAVVDEPKDMARQFEAVVGVPIDYEMLYVGEWRMNLLLADRYREGRVFLAGDAVHLVIPTGGLGMNTGVGDAIDLSWKLTAYLQGWGGEKLLSSYEIERRQIGDRNIGASRYASLGRRKWRSQWKA